MSTSPEPSARSPRVAALVDRFRIIGETAMRDLPLYNADLEVQAVGFRFLKDRWIGVLITPWFMNLIRLPEQPEPMDMNRIGHKLKVALPSGERQLSQAGDETIGAYESLSLHSPMFAFKTREAARQEADRQIVELMQPADEPVPDDGRLRIKPKKMSRRAFLGRAGSNA